MECPSNPDVLMANAVLAFQGRNFARAQQLIDELLALGPAYPDAAALRARIALEEGNAPFAARFLEQQIQRTGDHAGLREVYASALFLMKRFTDAEEQLNIADRLGAPHWRVLYGLGLIEEAQGHFAEARLRYQAALRERPGWAPAESRVKALEASRRPNS